MLQRLPLTSVLVRSLMGTSSTRTETPSFYVTFLTPHRSYRLHRRHHPYRRHLQPRVERVRVKARVTTAVFPRTAAVDGLASRRTKETEKNLWLKNRRVEEEEAAAVYFTNTPKRRKKSSRLKTGCKKKTNKLKRIKIDVIIVSHPSYNQSPYIQYMKQKRNVPFGVVSYGR